MIVPYCKEIKQIRFSQGNFIGMIAGNSRVLLVYILCISSTGGHVSDKNFFQLAIVIWMLVTFIMF